MRPLLRDLPLAYLAQLPPDLLAPAIEALPLARLLGPEAPRLARLYNEDAEPAPRFRFAVHTRMRVAAVYTRTETTLTAHLQREGLPLLLLLEKSALHWRTLVQTYRVYPLLLGLPLLYESCMAAVLPSGRTPPSAIARAHRYEQSEEAHRLRREACTDEPSHHVAVNRYARSRHRCVDKFVAQFLDPTLRAAVRSKQIALAHVENVQCGVRTMLLHDRVRARVYVAMQTCRAAQYRMLLGNAPLWTDWLVPAAKRVLRDYETADVRVNENVPLPEVMLEVAEHTTTPADDERSAVPWRADPPDLALDVAQLLCELSAGEVAEPPIAPDCPRLVHALLPYLLPRHPALDFATVHAQVHVAAGVAAPADLRSRAAITQCARAHEALPPDVRSPFADRDTAAWTLFFRPPPWPARDARPRGGSTE